MSMQPTDEPFSDGDDADLAARLHASLSGPSLAAATRQRHVHAIRAKAATLSVPAPAPSADRGWGRRLASTATAAGLVVVMGASGAVAASHDSLPGQALYRVKQATEQLVLAAPLPPGHLVDRHLSFADRRLREAITLADRDAQPTLVGEALTAHTRLLDRAGALAADDAALTARVDVAAAAAERRLSHLLAQGLPAAAADQARAALSAVQARLDRRPQTSPPATSVPAPPPQRQPAPLQDRPDPPAPPGSVTPAPATPPERSAPPRPAPGSSPPPGAREQAPQRQPGPATTPPEPGPQTAPSTSEQRGAEEYPQTRLGDDAPRTIPAQPHRFHRRVR